ncbi:DUF1330 domain-containing protein [Roseibium algae]|uniref:DUF1330 domain-containing protein n=1 Tax=Roseibium algae TaxID=3123038 RepID=A0ABU8TJI2_9HYPH
MTVQAIALITVTNKDILAKYRDVAGQALAKHGGRVVAGDPDPTVLEAAFDAPNIAALLEFPSVEAAQNWRNDPSLADIHALRNTGGKSTIVVLPS